MRACEIVSFLTISWSGLLRTPECCRSPVGSVLAQSKRMISSGIRAVFMLAVPIAVLLILQTYRRSKPELFYSAYRLALKLAIVYVLWLLVPAVRAYSDLVFHTRQNSGAIAARQQKVSAPDLEAEFVRMKVVAPNAGLRCKPAERDWDYVCSYMPTPSQSATRLEFGVIVDNKRWLNVSRKVPAGTSIPPPQ